MSSQELIQNIGNIEFFFSQYFFFCLALTQVSNVKKKRVEDFSSLNDPLNLQDAESHISWLY